MSAPAVGIDLGTTYSCVAVFRNERSEIIANAQGNRITPSVVSFGRERLIGEPAKIQEASNPENTVYGVKRLIGRRWEEPSVQQDILQWPFKVENEQGRPKVVVTHQGSRRSFFPEEISSMVLSCMKTAAEKYLGSSVRDAVVTVPAYFNDSQRQATKDAAAIAGLNVLRIINEPTAAALAYGLDHPVEGERHVLIFDLGGGTFDVSVLCIEEGVFEVRSTAGDTHLGGEDFDSLLTTHFVEEFRRRYGANLTGNNRALRRLRTASERAKRMLSSATEASVELDSLHEGRDFQATVTRARFEELCGDLFRRTLDPVRQALEDAQLSITDIEEVVLVGGSTRIPMVKTLLREFFNGRQLAQTVNPDEAVAAGAAVQAALLSGEPSEMVTDLVLLDVTPLTLGTDVTSGVMDVIIPRNTTIPVKKTMSYTTAADDQTTVNVDIREGERKMYKDNNLLGKFTLSNLPKLPAGHLSVKVTFELDADGILQASAVEQRSGIENKITIVNDKGRLSKAQIDKLLKEAEEFKAEDESRAETAKARNDLEQYCLSLKNKVTNDKDVTFSTKQTLTAKCDETLRWLSVNPNAAADECKRKKRDLDLICDLVFMKI